jgi:hypothetical protein
MLDQLGEPHREGDPFAKLLGVRPTGWRASAQSFHPRQQSFHILLEEPLSEGRVCARARQIGVGDRREGAHNKGAS